MKSIHLDELYRDGWTNNSTGSLSELTSEKIIYKAHCTSAKCCSVMGTKEVLNPKTNEIDIVHFVKNLKARVDKFVPETRNICPDCAQPLVWNRQRKKAA
jgi:hypothetical protein